MPLSFKKPSIDETLMIPDSILSSIDEDEEERFSENEIFSLAREACINGDLTTLRKYLDCSYNLEINKIDSFTNQSLLATATSYNHPELTEILLLNGAKFNLIPDQSLNNRSWIIEQKNNVYITILSYLYEAFAKISERKNLNLENNEIRSIINKHFILSHGIKELSSLIESKFTGINFPNEDSLEAYEQKVLNDVKNQLKNVVKQVLVKEKKISVSKSREQEEKIGNIAEAKLISSQQEKIQNKKSETCVIS